MNLLPRKSVSDNSISGFMYFMCYFRLFVHHLGSNRYAISKKISELSLKEDFSIWTPTYFWNVKGILPSLALAYLKNKNKVCFLNSLSRYNMARQILLSVDAVPATKMWAFDSSFIACLEFKQSILYNTTAYSILPNSTMVIFVEHYMINNYVIQRFKF